MRKPRIEHNHYVQYDKDKLEYSIEEKKKMGLEDLKNLSLIHIIRLDKSNMYYHFPNKKIHIPEYFQLFVNHIFGDSLNKEPQIGEKQITNLFKSKAKKIYITNVLGYLDDEAGRYGMREAIMRGTRFNDVAIVFASDELIRVKTRLDLYDTNNQRHEIWSVWNLKEDLSVCFVTIEIEK